MFFYKKIKKALRKFFRISKKAKLLVIPPIEKNHDFRHGLGCFFEDTIYLYDDDPKYPDLRKEVIFITADENHKVIKGGIPETTIIVYFDEDKTTISKIQQKLENIGIKTKVLQLN